MDAKPTPIGESEPNDDFANAAKFDLPAQITGVIDSKPAVEHDVDLYRFSAKAGQAWVFEVNASRSGSPLDSRIEILDEYGKNVLQTRLQATRESYFTFRGKDSSTSDDFRVHNWEDMELNEYLYSDGEVVKLWLYPRGPDSGFKVYPGCGLTFHLFWKTRNFTCLGCAPLTLFANSSTRRSLAEWIARVPDLLRIKEYDTRALGKRLEVAVCCAAIRGLLLKDQGCTWLWGKRVQIHH